jgi:hypothetical protein
MTVRTRTVAARLSLACWLAACVGQQSTTQTVILDKPEATLSPSFTQLSNVVELRDGRVAFADLKQRTFLFADLSSGKVDSIGKHIDSVTAGDSLSGRHKFPGYVIRLARDTVGLVDFALERTTLWTEQGNYAGVINPVAVAGHNQALAYDAEGHGYKEDVRAVLGGLEPGKKNVMLDSLALLRLSRTDTVADTIAKLSIPPWGEGRFGEQQKQVSTIFGSRDLFGVLPDGSIWVARASNNAVDWRSPTGVWTAGPKRPFARVAVTQADRDAFIDRLRAQMTKTGAPAGIELSYPFAEYKPPFSVGLTNPEGEVWLQRFRALTDSVPVWDVVGRDGKGIRVVRFAKGVTLAGFGRSGALYAVVNDGEAQKVVRFRVK